MPSWILERFSFQYRKAISFAFTTLVDSLKKLAPLFHQIRRKPKPTAMMYGGEIKGSETSLMLIYFCPRKIDSPQKHYTSFPLVTRKCCYVLGKLKKLIVYPNDEIPTIFSNCWEPGAQPKLAHAYYVSPL